MGGLEDREIWTRLSGDSKRQMTGVERDRGIDVVHDVADHERVQCGHSFPPEFIQQEVRNSVCRMPGSQPATLKRVMMGFVQCLSRMESCRR